MNKIRQVQPYTHLMDKLFFNLFSEFKKQQFLKREELPNYSGIYVFYKDSKPIYVGRAGNIRKRIQGHSRPSSGSESANFAFNLTKLELIEKISESKLGRKELMNEPWFKEKFSIYKQTLSASKIKCLKIENDIIQTMFEPYLAIKLGTYPKHNNFDNH